MEHWDRGDRHIGNMSDMMQRLQLDPVAVAQQRLGLTLAHAIRVCQRCDAGEICCQWLKRAPAHLHHPPAFCPNAEVFELLMRELPPASDTRH